MYAALGAQSNPAVVVDDRLDRKLRPWSACAESLGCGDSTRIWRCAQVGRGVDRADVLELGVGALDQRQRLGCRRALEVSAVPAPELGVWRGLIRVGREVREEFNVGSRANCGQWDTY